MGSCKIYKLFLYIHFLSLIVFCIGELLILQDKGWVLKPWIYNTAFVGIWLSALIAYRSAKDTNVNRWLCHYLGFMTGLTLLALPFGFFITCLSAEEKMAESQHYIVRHNNLLSPRGAHKCYRDYLLVEKLICDMGFDTELRYIQPCSLTEYKDLGCLVYECGKESEHQKAMEVVVVDTARYDDNGFKVGNMLDNLHAVVSREGQYSYNLILPKTHYEVRYTEQRAFIKGRIGIGVEQQEGKSIVIPMKNCLAECEKAGKDSLRLILTFVRSDDVIDVGGWRSDLLNEKDSIVRDTTLHKSDVPTLKPSRIYFNLARRLISHNEINMCRY